MGAPKTLSRMCSRPEALAIIAQSLDRNLNIDAAMAQGAADLVANVAKLRKKNGRARRPLLEGMALAINAASKPGYAIDRYETPDAAYRSAVGLASAQADTVLREAEGAGQISPVAGKYSVEEVKRLAPSKRGRGAEKGRGKNTFYDQGAVDRLVHFMLHNKTISNVKLAQMNLGLPYSGTYDSGTSTRYASSEFRGFRRYCWSHAHERIGRAKLRLHSRSKDASEPALPFTEDQIEKLEQNLMTWFDITFASRGQSRAK